MIGKLIFALISQFCAALAWTLYAPVCRESPVNVTMPSLYDINRKDFDMESASAYLRDVIFPAHDYFDTLHRLNARSSGEKTVFGISLALFFGWLYGVYDALSAFRFQGPPVLRAALPFILSLLCSGVLLLLAHFTEKALSSFALFSLREYPFAGDHAGERLRAEFNAQNAKPPYVPEVCAFNNFVLFTHYGYLLRLQDPARRRQILQKAAFALSLAAFLVFYFVYL